MIPGYKMPQSLSDLKDHIKINMDCIYVLWWVIWLFKYHHMFVLYEIMTPVWELTLVEVKLPDEYHAELHLIILNQFDLLSL